jgi:hypothetical protein
MITRCRCAAWCGGGAPTSNGQGCEPELLLPLLVVDDDSLWTLMLKLLLLELRELP